MKQEIQKIKNKKEKLSPARLTLRISVTVILFGLYILVFPRLYFWIGEAATMLALLPVSVSAWIWKFKMGTALSLLVIPIHGYLFSSLGLLEKGSFIHGLPPIITTVMLAGTIGWLSEISGLYRKLALDYRNKHSDLEAEIERRKSAEEELSLLNSNLQCMVDERTKELLDAKNRAEESDRLKSDFLTQVSHEIRTPLSNILNYTSLVKEITSDKNDEALGICFTSIESSSNRLIRTIEMIINISQIQQNKFVLRPEPLDIERDILDPLVKEIYPAALNKGLELLYVPAGISGKILADQYALTQIFDNLLDNAIKFTNQGHVELKTVAYENELAVVVSDTGIGISEEYQKILFEPFSQEDTGYTRRYEGNGLGLALAKKYCELNNARIHVKSRKGQGSEFKVVFKNYK
ncbi:MAG TPA: HAMP domain-containing sensor histidine kinase [Ignavibacteriales bacterium]|nr:HAMP domain-containing sensor histidine kinase [Ignavibacteriales bacterium]